MGDRTYTEREVYEYKMGRPMTDREIQRISPKRYPYKPGTLEASPNIWKRCDICGLHFVVNAWPDHKARTPRFKGFVICVECDPRHGEDRYKKEGYRIVHPRRNRIVAMAMIARALSQEKCLSGKKKCKCIHCIARKLQLD